MVLLIIYMIAGYWATGKTIYANRVILTTHFNMFFSKLIWGTFLGWVLIPWALIKEFAPKK